MEIRFEDFEKIEIRAGTIRSAKLNIAARVPAYVLEIDLGSMGIRTSSAQLTANYDVADLIGRQVVAVTNFPPKRVAGVRSELLVLGVVSEKTGTVLLVPERPVPDGERVL